MTVTVDLGDEVAEIRCSTIRDGDFHVESAHAALLHRRHAFAPGVWTQLDEVHGTLVRAVTHPGEHDIAVGDAAVTRCRGAVLSAWVGDCAPVMFVADEGVIAAAHAGWRGALDGVLAAVIAAMGAPRGGVRAFLGPCIHPCCYEFGPADLQRLTDRFGAQVAGRTTWGTAALDMRAVVRAALAEHDIALTDLSQCTGCRADLYFSHRRRAQSGRQVMTVCKRAAR